MPNNKEDSIDEEQIEESKLEEELENFEEKIDSGELIEFLQQAPEIENSSPVLEKIASAAEIGPTVFIQGEDKDKELENLIGSGPKYLENPEEADNANKYLSNESDIKYTQQEGAIHQPEHVDIRELGRNPAEVFTQKIHSRQSSELKGIESASRENYVTPKRQETRDIGKRNWLEEKEKERVKYKSGI